MELISRLKYFIPEMPLRSGLICECGRKRRRKAIASSTSWSPRSSVLKTRPASKSVKLLVHGLTIGSNFFIYYI